MTTPKELVKSIADLTTEFNRKRKEMMDALKPQFHDLFIEFFEKNPTVGAISWTQYTPYFNDGESCEFSRHEFQAHSLDAIKGDFDAYNGDMNPNTAEAWAVHYFTTDTLPSGWPFDTYPTDELWEKSYYGKNGTKLHYLETSLRNANINRENYKERCTVSANIKELMEGLQQIPEEAYEQMFGDHVQVVVTRDGVEVEEYEHD